MQLQRCLRPQFVSPRYGIEKSLFVTTGRPIRQAIIVAETYKRVRVGGSSAYLNGQAAAHQACAPVIPKSLKMDNLRKAVSRLRNEKGRIDALEKALSSAVKSKSSRLMSVRISAQVLASA